MPCCMEEEEEEEAMIDGALSRAEWLLSTVLDLMIQFPTTCLESKQPRKRRKRGDRGTE